MRIKNRQVTIFKKLMFCFLTVCVIPLLFTSILVYEMSASNMEGSYMELATIFSSQMITNMDEFVEEYDRATKSILLDFELIHSLNKEDEQEIEVKLNQQLNLRRVMMRLLTLKPEIREIALITENGDVYQLGNNGETIEGDLLKQQVWLKQFQDSDEIFSLTSVHDKAYYESQKDGLTITVCRRILDYNNRYVGVLLMDLEPDSLIQLNEDFLLARNQYNIKIMITNNTGGMVFDSDVASGRVTWQEAMDTQGISLYERNPDDYLIMSDETSGGELKITIVIPTGSLLMRLTRVKLLTYIIVACSILVVISTSFVVSRNIASPIRKLQNKMRRVEEGDYEEFHHKDSQIEINSLVSSYNHMVRRIRDLIEKVYLSEIKQKNAKLLALQTQINPHMLYNTLEAIRMKAIVNDEDEIADMIKVVARMFRMALSNKKTTYTIRDDIEYAQTFVALHNIRLPEVFSLSIRMDERIRDLEIIPLILQPLVENSIEHGYRGNSIPLRMILTAEYDSADVVIRLKDDGNGMSEDRVEQINEWILAKVNDRDLGGDFEQDHNSIGLVNIAQRLNLSYGSSYYLQIMSSNEQGTVVEIRIPG